MQDAASVLTDRFAEVLARLPADLDLDDLAMESKAIQPRREVVDGAALLRIALARGPGGLSLRQTAARASMQGIAELSNPGVKYRLDQATDFLALLVERLLAAKVPGPELRWPGRTLRLADGTCVSEPGSTGTDWRVHGVFDLGRGGFSHLELTDVHGAEALERGAPHLSSDSLIVAHLALPFVIEFGDRLMDGEFEMLDGSECPVGEEVAL